VITQSRTAAPSQTEGLLLLVPILGAVIYGLGPFLLGAGFGLPFGEAGNDSFLYRCAGAATFGYAVGLAIGLRDQSWTILRLPLIGTLTFGVVSIFVGALEILGGNHNALVYLTELASILVTVITATLVMRHSGEPQVAPDVSKLLGYGLILGGVLAGVFGVLPLLIPSQFAQLFGYKGTDVFFIRQAGAASLGYAVVAYLAFQSRVWREVRPAALMALTFNALGFVAAVLALLNGDPLFIAVVIGVAGFFYSVMVVFALQRQGQV
jgi:hypothetical protein